MPPDEVFLYTAMYVDPVRLCVTEAFLTHIVIQLIYNLIMSINSGDKFDLRVLLS